MPAGQAYTFYLLNRSGVIDSSVQSHHPDVDSALLYAREMRHIGAVEVYAGKRRVGLVPPVRADPYAALPK